MEQNNLDPGAAFVNDFKLFTEGKNFWQASLIIQVEGLTMSQALFKPDIQRHGIWQIVRHIAYWKHWALTYLRDNIKLNAKEDNWAPLPDEQTESSWLDDVEKLKSLNKECIAEAEKLGNRILNSGEENIVFFRQVLYHDSYHCGQIGYLRAMQGIPPVE